MSHSFLVDVLLLSTFLVIASNGIELQERASDTSAAASIMMKELEGFKMLANLADRDLNIWWAQFNQTMQNYTDIKDEKACTDPNGLNNTLILLEQKIDVYLEYGLRQKVKQLGEIKVIIEKDEFKNSTGLYNALKTYIEGHEAQASRERILLNNETKTVDDEIKWLKEKVCHCSWKAWAAWTNCSHDCNGGTQTRNRTFYARRNGGNFCDGDSIEIQQCNQGSCPVDCAWGQWGSWGTCSAECMEGTKRRTRTKSTVAQHNGNDCTGDSYEEMSCNTKEELQQTLTQTQTRIANNEQQCRAYFSAEVNALIVGGDMERNGYRYGYKTLIVDFRNGSTQTTPIYGHSFPTCLSADYPHEGEGMAGGAVISFNDTLMPVVCGGQRAGDKCYGYKYHSGEWELVNTMPKQLGYLSMASIGKGWMFVAGGEEWGKGLIGKWTKSTYMLNAAGDIINGPDLDDKINKACPAIISDNGDTKVVAILGGTTPSGGVLTMRRFQCSINGSTPSCLKLSNGPDMPLRPANSYERYLFSCGVLHSNEGKDVLYAWRKSTSSWAKSRALDLSSDNSTWQEVDTPFGHEITAGNYNFVTNKNKTIGYLFGVRGRDKFFRITSRSTTDIEAQVKQLPYRVYLKGYHTILPVPNDKFFCDPSSQHCWGFEGAYGCPRN